MSKQHITPLALALSLFLTAPALQAAPSRPVEAPMTADEYEARVERASANPKTLAAGKRAAFLCLYCHGEDGNSVQENIPNLAGQNPVYLLTQIEKFGDGRRKDEFMSGLIKSLSNEDRVNMAVYYAAMRPIPARVEDERLVAQGRKRYLATCSGCHGPNATGNKSIARLAGQRVSYLTQALNNYRSSTPPRTDPVMTLIARKLPAADIPLIATYLSTLK
mgnify:CR=1 FL=1